MSIQICILLSILSSKYYFNQAGFSTCGSFHRLCTQLLTLPSGFPAK